MAECAVGREREGGKKLRGGGSVCCSPSPTLKGEDGSRFEFQEEIITPRIEQELNTLPYCLSLYWAQDPQHNSSPPPTGNPGQLPTSRWLRME